MGRMGTARRTYSALAADYKLLEEIGYGASATVYRAIFLPSNEIVAVKCLDLDRCNSNLVRPFSSPHFFLFSSLISPLSAKFLRFSFIFFFPLLDFVFCCLISRLVGAEIRFDWCFYSLIAAIEFVPFRFFPAIRLGFVDWTLIGFMNRWFDVRFLFIVLETAVVREDEWFWFWFGLRIVVVWNLDSIRVFSWRGWSSFVGLRMSARSCQWSRSFVSRGRWEVETCTVGLELQLDNSGKYDCIELANSFSELVVWPEMIEI